MPQTPFRTALAACLLLAGSLSAATAFATDVVMRTTRGDIEIELFDAEAPQTVANFLAYVRNGAYDDSMIFRSVPGFVLQGGGYKLLDGVFDFMPDYGPVMNEPGRSNTRGTLAMAKIPGEPDSGTNQWFINLVDNPELDDQNEGFTVFGRVKDDSMGVVEDIAGLQRWNLGTPFTAIPLIGWDGVETLTLDNFVIADIDEVIDFPANPGLNDAWYLAETAGQGLFFTHYPEGGNLFLSWFTFDVERPAEEVTATVGEPGHRWITGFGSIEGNRAELSATLTRGGVFDANPPGPENVPGVGSIVVEFQDCDSALVNYAFPDVPLHGTIKVERVVKDNVSLCEALVEANDAE